MAHPTSPTTLSMDAATALEHARKGRERQQEALLKQTGDLLYPAEGASRGGSGPRVPAGSRARAPQTLRQTRPARPHPAPPGPEKALPHLTLSNPRLPGAGRPAQARSCAAHGDQAHRC